MHDPYPRGSSRTPLDFNLPRCTDMVADALVSDSSPCDPQPVSDLDTGVLLAEAGVPGHAVRSIVTSWPASEV